MATPVYTYGNLVAVTINGQRVPVSAENAQYDRHGSLVAVLINGQYVRMNTQQINGYRQQERQRGQHVVGPHNRDMRYNTYGGSQRGSRDQGPRGRERVTDNTMIGKVTRLPDGTMIYEDVENRRTEERNVYYGRGGGGGGYEDATAAKLAAIPWRKEPRRR